jgi:hypothetical protein
MLSAASHSGFRKAGSGLLVPMALERTREVWTADERKAVDRAAKLFAARGLRMVLTCSREGCRGTLTRLAGGVAGDRLECDCTARVLSRNL